MPKKLDEDLSDLYLKNNVTLKKVLQPIYTGMQHIAVGLEQMSFDHMKEEPSIFYNDLKNITKQLKHVSLMLFQTRCL